MNCKNCTTELTQMKDGEGKDSCLRCLKCHPMPNGNAVIKAKKENVKVDEPWTPDRIWAVVEPKVRELFVDLIEDYVIAQSKNDESKKDADEGFVHDLITKKTWQEQAKAMGINPYGRKKEIVLAEMAEQTKGPEEPVDNESP